MLDAARQAASSNARVLMVDDDRAYAEMVVAFLREEGFHSESVCSGMQALRLTKAERFDVMVLDVMMPGMSGHEVLRRLQSRDSGLSPLPVLMLTARGDEVDRIVGLETGADDYLAKPCNLRELAARLRAILRRAKPATDGHPPAATVIDVANVRLDCSALQATQSGKALHLTGAEFAILRLLMASAGQPVSKETLTSVALGRKFLPYDRSVDVHITNLRKKLDPIDGAGPLIKTIRGAGYQFVSPAVA